ncbi:hypothetical protein PJ985_06405 [Streptomyces sp. ACA25]|uniref:hypothetical protein n=1 Tax=Streptomyces sp. ACA25 TaxID=3022596 RepID=UPI0023072C2E|nr:hypothetical protein [Streptomyces sp. ACA25]MDB1087200.1 hypothetical protein [Streptomyces sp. ACA25]
MTSRDPELKKDLDAAVQTRKELGDTYESEVVDSFLEKVGQRIDSTVDQRVRRQLAEQQLVLGRRGPGGPPAGESRGPGPAFGLAALSLVLAVPLSAVAATQAGLPGLLVCWAGIVGVNVCYAHAGEFRRLRRRSGEGSDWE